jgi:hypothetical protein
MQNRNFMHICKFRDLHHAFQDDGLEKPNNYSGKISCQHHKTEQKGIIITKIRNKLDSQDRVTGQDSLLLDLQF